MQELQEAGFRTLRGVGTWNAKRQIHAESNGAARCVLAKAAQKDRNLANRTWFIDVPTVRTPACDSDPALAGIDAPIRVRGKGGG
jgi:hypothetical protein